MDVFIMGSHLALDGLVTTESVLDVGNDCQVVFYFAAAAHAKQNN
jgi:hypothetical protein